MTDLLAAIRHGAELLAAGRPVVPAMGDEGDALRALADAMDGGAPVAIRRDGELVILEHLGCGVLTSCDMCIDMSDDEDGVMIPTGPAFNFPLSVHSPECDMGVDCSCPAGY